MDDQKRFVEVRYLCKSEQGREGDEGDGRWVLFSSDACKRRRDRDLIENETCGSSEKLAQEVMVEEQRVGKARL